MISKEEELINKIKSSIMSLTWDEIVQSNNILREKTFLIDNRLKLEEVAFTLTQDRDNQLDYWVNNGLINIPLPKEVEIFQKELQKFNFIVISPYCIIQEL